MRLEIMPNYKEMEEMARKCMERTKDNDRPRPFIIDYFERLYEYNGNERYLQAIDLINQVLAVKNEGRE